MPGKCFIKFSYFLRQFFLQFFKDIIFKIIILGSFKNYLNVV